MNDLTSGFPRKSAEAPAASTPPIGEILVLQRKISSDDLDRALELQRDIDAQLGDILIGEGLISKRDILSALAVQARTRGADLDRQPPQPELSDMIPAQLCLRFGVVPWRMEGPTLYVATSSPPQFVALQEAMENSSLLMFPVIVDEHQIKAQQSRLFGVALAVSAEASVPLAESCRSWSKSPGSRLRWASATVILTGALVGLAPLWTITVLSLVAVFTLLLTSLLKAAALTAHLFEPQRPCVQQSQVTRQPRVSVLVPLLREREIAGHLVARLSALTYPKSLLEVVLVLEQDDEMTRETIARTKLPGWISVVEVPKASGLATKPRALNYALNFCSGTIIGVWDAEDWPEPDQIERVVARFQEAPENIACLQGVLDYYNARTSWLARCFTVEYAMWWRIVMPGIETLGLVVPLGGTTLFFRRKVLEELNGWDAHNVTEDADLGVRLARYGYKTEILQTVTREEATSRPWAWVRQRSRWLKGFMVTYFVHMRSPAALLRDLGPMRFLGLQIMFLASFLQFAAAPLLWSFGVTLFGITHPVGATLGMPVIWVLAGIFFTAEVLSLSLGMVAIASRAHRHLYFVLPTMTLYFALGTLAAYKALWELIHVPFYWDKTQHGVTPHLDPAPEASTPIDRSAT